ncbi:hypothetical protein HMPREF2600_03770 [Neisseria sp. HMSC077D05]|uniref:hypothetical protein n=1 Tax=Neisseria sp. HMSC077D05 TaxID=1715079 RepID=UPI0008A5A281|nr:hypothetical protein [Neisseria sp. HMSC077D05]OFN27165.1 hypothetical protein HMPREF2600_03770 [Neisseria sp. HMSC077D05]
MNSNKNSPAYFDYIANSLSIIFKLSLLIGGTSSILYFIKIGHIPSNLSLGDGLLFLLVSACITINYVVFAVLSTSFGIVLTQLINYFFGSYTKKIIKIYNIHRIKKGKKGYKSYYKLAKIESPVLLFSIIYLITLIITYEVSQDIYIIITLVLMSIAQCIFYSMWNDSQRQFSYIENNILIKNYKADGIKYPLLQKNSSKQNIQKLHMFIPVFIIILPILMGNFPMSGFLLDSSMRLAKIRLEKPSAIYIKKPYSNILPKSLILKKENQLNDFTAFTNIKILFRGFGTTTIISFQEGESEKRIGIPNEDLIIETEEKNK